MTTVGLVLAAGAGRRMGGPRPSCGSPTVGPTLVETAVARVVEGGCDRVVVVVGAAGDAGRCAVLEGPGAAVVHADDWDEGMGASLRAGLAHLEQGDDDLALVTLVDLPDVTADVVRRVLAAALARGGRRCAGGLRRRAGHPVAIGRDHWAAVIADRPRRPRRPRPPASHPAPPRRVRRPRDRARPRHRAATSTTCSGDEAA